MAGSSHLRVAVCWNNPLVNVCYLASTQPPSGGCVLKQFVIVFIILRFYAATFGWLCVETALIDSYLCYSVAATFGWLCVETISPASVSVPSEAATFGWLCVETRFTLSQVNPHIAATFGWLCVETTPANNFASYPSAATFGWLCVETTLLINTQVFAKSSHLRVAVCWNATSQKHSQRKLCAATFGWLCVETIGIV